MLGAVGGQRVFVFKTGQAPPRTFEGEYGAAFAGPFGNDANADPQPLDPSEIALADALPAGHADGQRGPRVTHQEAPLDLDRHLDPSSCAQCAIRTGSVMLASTVRVAPPSSSSRTRECP